MTAIRSDDRTREMPVAVAPVGVPGGARSLGLVFALVLATRLPFALTTPGVGGDPDSWRLLLAGRMLVDTGKYWTSRQPGYPVVELVSAALAGSPWGVYVVATAVVGALAVTAFADLLRTLRVRAWWWPTAAVALTPVVYRSDLTFMDYSWSLAAAMGSLALLARGRWVWAGVLFGLAVGCRPASAVLLVVVCAVLVGTRAARAAWVRVAVPAVVIAGGFMAVPLAVFGFGVLSAVPAHASLPMIVARSTTAVWGTAGAVVVLVALAVAVLRLGRGTHDLDHTQRTWALAALAAVVAMGALFLVLPADPAYLVPMVPMVLLAVALTVPRRGVAVLAVVLAVSAFVAPFGSSRFSPTVLSDRAVRVAADAAARENTAAMAALPPYTVVLSGVATPELLALQPRAVLADPSLTGVFRSWDPPGQVILPGKKLLSADPLTVPSTMPVYRLPTGSGDAPLVPGSR